MSRLRRHLRRLVPNPVETGSIEIEEAVPLPNPQAATTVRVVQLQVDPIVGVVKVNEVVKNLGVIATEASRVLMTPLMRMKSW